MGVGVTYRYIHPPLPSVCVCVSGIIIPALYSGLITSWGGGLLGWVGVNPGMTRRRSSNCCICNLSVFGGISQTHNQTTVPFTPEPTPPTTTSILHTPPPRITATLISKPHSLNLLDHNMKGINSFERLNPFHGIWQRSSCEVPLCLCFIWLNCISFSFHLKIPEMSQPMSNSGTIWRRSNTLSQEKLNFYLVWCWRENFLEILYWTQFEKEREIDIGDVMMREQGMMGVDVKCNAVGLVQTLQCAKVKSPAP